MNELKYLSSVYEQANEELKKQPAFLECLKNIDGMIAVSQTLGYVGGRYQVEASDNAVKVDLFYSYFGDKPITMENNNRTGHEFEINLDENHNLCYQDNSSSFIPKSIIINGEPQFGNSSLGTYDYSRLFFKNGTEEVIGKQQVLGQKTEITYMTGMPLFDPNNNDIEAEEKDPEKIYESYDRDIKWEIKNKKPNYMNNLISLGDKIEHQNWTAWSATRNPQNPNLAMVEEFIQPPLPYGEITTKSTYEAPINMSAPKVMRIDPPYSITSYTVEQIEEIIKLRCEIHDNQKLQEAVQDMLYQRNGRGRK